MEDSPLIHPDIKKAHTLPSKYYTESSVFGEIISKLSKSFHFAAHINQFEKNNNKNFKTKTVIKKLDVTPLKKNTINFLNWFLAKMILLDINRTMFKLLN